MLISSLETPKKLIVSVVVLLLGLIALSSGSFATTTSAGTVVKVTSDQYTYGYNETFLVNVEIENPQNYYAEDITIWYDSTVFDYVTPSVEVADAQQLKIYHEETTTGGAVRVIVASNGANNVVKYDQKILKLKFKAKSNPNGGYIGISSAKAADGFGNEYNLLTQSRKFYLGSMTSGDVNPDGIISLSDLGIASRLMGTSDYEWGGYNPDVNNNNTVDDYDLEQIVDGILK